MHRQGPGSVPPKQATRPEAPVPSVPPAQPPVLLPGHPYHCPEPRQETAGGSAHSAASRAPSVPGLGHEAAALLPRAPHSPREAGCWPARTQGPQNGVCRRQLCPEARPGTGSESPAADGPFLRSPRGLVSGDQAAHRNAAARAPRGRQAAGSEGAGREGAGAPALGSHLFGSCWSCLFAHPVPSLGTITMLGSCPLFSDFRLGRLAGGGIRRAVATLPRLCKPCLGIAAGRQGWKQVVPGRGQEAGGRYFKPQVLATGVAEHTRGVAPPRKQTARPSGHLRPWRHGSFRVHSGQRAPELMAVTGARPANPVPHGRPLPAGGDALASLQQDQEDRALV